MADEKITMTPFGPSSNKANDGGSYSASITASYELDLWGRVRASRKASNADFEASAQDLQSMAMAMSGQIASTWYELVEQRKKIEILEVQVETNKSYLEIITLMYEQGLSPAADVLQQKQQVSATEGELLGAKMLHQLTEQRFAVLMGKHPTTKYYFEEEYIPELPPLPDTGIPSDLILNRPDVKAARLRLEAADYRVYEAIANQFPQISLSATATDTDDRFRSLFDSWTKNLAANLMMPIFNGGLLRSQVKLNRAAASGQLHAFEKTVLLAITEVESALTQERIQKEMVENFNQQLEISRQALEFTKIRYQNGATSYIPVLINLTTVQRLERTQIEAKRTQMTYRINLYRALGGGIEMDRPQQDKVTFKAGVKK
jgi:outer membrane protein, multidrug efflux system